MLTLVCWESVPIFIWGLLVVSFFVALMDDLAR